MPASLTALREVPRTDPGPRTPDPGFIVFHPRYDRFLRRCGIDSADAALDLRGEVVCGHPDRHVVRCELPAGPGTRVVYLKREHVVGVRTRLRNRLAGFGPVSRAEREAAVLKRLEQAGLPGPQWLAYGESADGRAFLLVDEVADADDLRAVLGDTTLSPADRRGLIERAGRVLAELHAAGFGTPDLAAKHVLVSRRALAVTLVDWQSAGAPPTAAERARQLAGLHASLADGLASSRERLRFVRAYLRGTGRDEVPRFGAFVGDVLRHADRLKPRSSTRDQRATAAPRLVWLADEEVCVVPEMAALWPTPAACPPFYPDADGGADQEWITFPDGRRARLVRFTTYDPLGRLAAAVRERPWRSPAARVARLLFHLHRHGVDAPKLLAFGQRLTGRATAASFVVFDPPACGVPAGPALAEWAGEVAVRRQLLRECGRTLRHLHDAGCRLARTTDTGPALCVTTDGLPGVAVGSPLAVRLSKRIDDAVRRADLRWLVTAELRALPRTDRARVLRGYLGADRRTTAFSTGVL